MSQDDDSKSIVERMRVQLGAPSTAGARGVKVWKDVGLPARDASGALVMPNDSRVVAVLQFVGPEH